MSEKESDFLFLAVGGLPGSGKDTLGDYLEQLYKMQHISAGNVLRQTAAEMGYQPPYSRELLGEVGDALHEKYGAAPISKKAYEAHNLVKDNYPGGLVISGLRRIHEVGYIHEKKGTVAYVETPDSQRLKFLQTRSRDDSLSIEALRKREADEFNGTAAEGHDGVWIEGVRNKADVIIQNDGTLEDFYKKIDNMMHSLREK